MTPEQMIIAAEMLEARKVKIDSSTTHDQMEAASFIFDKGIMHRGHDFCDEVAQVLREKAAEASK